ncbi:MAG: DDE-type integrase/transposase/recombinase [Oceanospirillaceae bacterium]|nr:DDE-type integrase/transposase/recombinase [Oceanospirillaceae bacterium]
MKEWFTAKELAGLEGLPTSDRRVRERAKTGNWTSRDRASGKGQEYHVSSLPIVTQEKLKVTSSLITDSGQKGILVGQSIAKESKYQCTNKQTSLAEYNSLSRTQKNKVDAKLEILLSIDSSPYSIKEFIEKYNSHQIEVDITTKQLLPRLRMATVYEWRSNYKNQGLAALAGSRGKHRKGTGMIDNDEDLKGFIIGMLVENPHISNTVLNKAIKAEFSGKIELPSLRTIDRWINKWKADNRQVFVAITNPDQWKNEYMQAFGSGNEHVTALNQLWEFDSTPADLMLEDGRHNIIGVIDVYSRRIRFVVSRTSNSKGVAQVIRQAILDWGIPQVAKTDNGADYKSKYIQSVFHALDIKQEFCPPFQAWKKPHIERVFRSFSHDLLELLPGFIGHNVADRKQIEARKQFSDRLFKKDEVIEIGMSSEELQAFCNNWIDNEYHVRTHRELKKTPNQMVREWSGTISRIENERALDILLSEPAGHRIVGKKGISVEGGKYIHPELGAIIGDQVHVYYDEHDMGRIFVYDMNNQFVCVAEDPAVTGVSRKEVAAKTKEVQREAVQEEKRRLKAAAKKISKRDIANEILAHQAQRNLEENTLSFPRPSHTHTTERLEAAANALAAREGIKQSGLTSEQRNQIEETRNEIKGQLIQPEFNRKLELPTDPAAKYLYWLDLDIKAKAGLELNEQQQRFHKTFPLSAEFGGGKMLAELRQQTASQ